MKDKPKCDLCGKQIGGGREGKRCLAGFDETLGGDDVEMSGCNGDPMGINVRDVLRLRAALKEALDAWHGYILSEGCGQVLEAYEGEAQRIAELRKLLDP